MSQLKKDVNDLNQKEQSQVVSSEEKIFRDYDDQPYSNDNVLVRSYKRRALLVSASDF